MNRYFAWFGLRGSLVLTVLMSAYALVLAAAFLTPVRLLCAAAMVLSSVGDVFLMHEPWIERRFPNYFTIGAAFFMAAHLLYTACFALKIRAQGAAYWNGGAAAALLIAAVCFLYFTAVCKNPKLYPLAVAYLCVITLNCMTVFSYAWSAWRTDGLAIPAAVGALSFLLSDLIIGLGSLAGIRRYDHLIWWLYPIGQILLITGAGR